MNCDGKIELNMSTIFVSAVKVAHLIVDAPFYPASAPGVDGSKETAPISGAFTFL